MTPTFIIFPQPYASPRTDRLAKKLIDHCGKARSDGWQLINVSRLAARLRRDR